MKKKIITFLVTTISVITLIGCTSSEYKQYVDLGEYKNLKLTTTGLTDEKISDEDVNNQIRDNITLYSPDLLKETNEKITEESCVSLDGTAQYEGSDASTFSLSNKMISELKDINGLADVVIGKSVNDKINTTLNLDSGKLTVNLTITSVVEDPLKLLTDDWVVKYAASEDIKTTKDYKKYIKEQLESQIKESNKTNKLSVIEDKIKETSKIKKYPENAIKKEIEIAKAQYEAMGKLYNLDIKTNIMTTNNLSSDEDYEKFIKSIATEEVDRNLIYNRIAEKEKLVPSDEDYTKKLSEYKSEHKDSYDSIDVIGEDTAKQYILNDIVDDWLYEHNTVSEKNK